MEITLTAAAALPDLVGAQALAGFRGGPFPPSAVVAAADAIRAECGWHIAPVITQTARLRVEGDLLLLPSLRVLEVLAVAAPDGTAVPGWVWEGDAAVRMPSACRGPRVVDVTFRHGYLECPPALLPALAERAAAHTGGRIKQESLAGRSVSLEGGYDPTTSAAMDRHRLHWRP